MLPSEIAARYLNAGYRAIAITDHSDYSNIDNVIAAILNFTGHWPKDSSIKVLPGVELTQLPLTQFKPLSEYARSKGIKIIVAHGESPAEPVIKGTNRAALEADIDILAHPGSISDEDVILAKEKKIFLEITSRKGHCQTNRYVAEKALKLNAELILDNDCHAPADILSLDDQIKIGIDAGLNREKIDSIFRKTGEFIERKDRAK